MNPTLPSTAARVFATLAVVVISSGCAMKGDIRTVQMEIRAIAARQDSLVAELRMEARQTQDTLRTQSDQIFDFRGDIAQQLRDIEQSLVRLEAIAGENQRGMASIRDQLANLRRTPTPAGPPGPASDTSGAADPGGASESVVGGGGGNADELYAVARTQLDRGSLNSASQAFEQFISEYPNDARIPDAHFFLADILTQQDRPEDALEAFQQLPELFPTAARVPQALYRIALLHEEAGDLEEAKAVLERIMNTYPDDLVSMLAREKLREIG